MRGISIIKVWSFVVLSSFIFVFTQSFAATETTSTTNKIDAVVTAQVFEKAKNNNDWKLAFLTAKNAQIVFMNISPSTNPNNEIGAETHTFDQIIFVVEGNAKAILNGKSSVVKAGDMIFIPEGVQHNVINLNVNKPLKIISVYSANDMPANTAYKKKSDEPQT